MQVHETFAIINLRHLFGFYLKLCKETSCSDWQTVSKQQHQQQNKKKRPNCLREANTRKKTRKRASHNESNFNFDRFHQATTISTIATKIRARWFFANTRVQSIGHPKWQITLIRTLIRWISRLLLSWLPSFCFFSDLCWFLFVFWFRLKHILSRWIMRFS